MQKIFLLFSVVSIIACKQDATKQSMEVAQQNAIKNAPEINNTLLYECYNNAFVSVAKGAGSVKVTITQNNNVISEFKAEQVAGKEQYEGDGGSVVYEADGSVMVIDEANVFKGCKPVLKK